MGKIFYSYFKSDDIENIVSGLGESNEYSCVIPHYDTTTELLLSRVIHKLTHKVSQDDSSSILSVIINELVTYIDKLNIKREYFSINNLDINNSADYFKGIETIDNFYSQYMNSTQNKPKKNYIKLKLRITEDFFNIKIINSNELALNEIKEIENAIKIVDNIANINIFLENYSSTTDNPEFNLMFLLMLLKNISADFENFTYFNLEDESDYELNIKFNTLTSINKVDITKEIINEIDSLPQFPESIQKLQKELMDPEWNYSRITDYILSDPNLTAEILRLVNSPVYRVTEEIDKVSTAVKIIGLTGLKAILYNFGIIQILGSKYNINKMDQLKEHLFKVALISSYLANFRKLNNFAEDIYVAALMHDLGKIIITALAPELSEKIKVFCSNKMIPAEIMDDLTDGYNHSAVGAELCKKWNFPNKYINVIKYHHSPMKVESDYKIITYCVYLGNEISHILENKGLYRNINRIVLKFFNLETEELFNKFLEKIKNEGLYL